MTQATANPITADRFAKGKTFREYVESGIRNKELFEQNYNGLVISPAQAAKLKALAAKPGGPHHMVVIGEDWCPDVYRGLGVAQKIAEAMGIELRMFERDQHKDMIQPYLKDGQFESIPVYVFYDKDHRELGHFIERPKLANEQLHVTRDVLGDMSPEGIAKRLGHEPDEAEIAAERAKAREKYLTWQRESEIWAGWRTAAVDEIIELLS
ncbi:MAG: thioredoxin family protein [Chloroflexi bacterium]|nr:thioredoxin family protein [Chloroflexota bacterium]